jgi:hypothetical protein
MSSNEERPANSALSDEALDQLFRRARSFSYWLEQRVSDDTLRRLYELMKFGPTSANGSPRAFCSFEHRKPSNGSGTWWGETDKPEARRLVEYEAGHCPGGRLVAWDRETGKPLEPKFEPSLGLIEDK